jgi:hypothetical protein
MYSPWLPVEEANHCVTLVFLLETIFWDGINSTEGDCHQCRTLSFIKEIIFLKDRFYNSVGHDVTDKSRRHNIEVIPKVRTRIRKIRDHFPREPWVRSCNGYIEFYLFLSYRNNALLKIIAELL